MLESHLTSFSGMIMFFLPRRCKETILHTTFNWAVCGRIPPVERSFQPGTHSLGGSYRVGTVTFWHEWWKSHWGDLCCWTSDFLRKKDWFGIWDLGIALVVVTTRLWSSGSCVEEAGQYSITPWKYVSVYSEFCRKKSRNAFLHFLFAEYLTALLCSEFSYKGSLTGKLKSSEKKFCPCNKCNHKIAPQRSTLRHSLTKGQQKPIHLRNSCEAIVCTFLPLCGTN